MTILLGSCNKLVNEKTTTIISILHVVISNGSAHMQTIP